MLLRLVLFAILLYFVIKAVGNLMRAVLHDPKAQTRMEEHTEPPVTLWSGPSQERVPRRDQAVEDARWVDLD